MKQKTNFTLIFILLSGALNIANAGVVNNHYFSASYMVEDYNTEKLQDVAIRDIDLKNKNYSLCDYNKTLTPHFVNLIIKSSHYGPRYGYRTYNVDVYYLCA